MPAPFILHGSPMLAIAGRAARSFSPSLELAAAAAGGGRALGSLQYTDYRGHGGYSGYDRGVLLLDAYGFG